MVAVLVHEVIGIAFVLLPHFLHNPLHIFFREVSTAQNYGFSVEISGGKDLDGNTTRSTHYITLKYPNWHDSHNLESIPVKI